MQGLITVSWISESSLEKWEANLPKILMASALKKSIETS